jgi:hypothetical protein
MIHAIIDSIRIAVTIRSATGCFRDTGPRSRASRLGRRRDCNHDDGGLKDDAVCRQEDQSTRPPPCAARDQASGNKGKRGQEAGVEQPASPP